MALSEGLAHASSAALAAALSMSLLFPLDQLRLRRQYLVRRRPAAHLSSARLLEQIVRTEGVRGLYVGLPASVFAIVVANFVYFFLYNILRQRAGRHRTGAITAMAIPAISGALNVLCLNPLFVISARLRVASRGEFASLAEAIRRICKEGPKTLWQGVVPSLWLVSNPTIQYFVYERLKASISRHAARLDRKVSSLEFFLAGAISKTVATVATYPLQVAQTLLRTQRPAVTTVDEKPEGTRAVAEAADADKQYRGMIECLLWLKRERGIGGLYCGLESKLWQTVLTASLMFAIYERLAELTLRTLRVTTSSTRLPTKSSKTS